MGIGGQIETREYKRYTIWTEWSIVGGRPVCDLGHKAQGMSTALVVSCVHYGFLGAIC